MSTPADSSADLSLYRKVRIDLGERAYDVIIGRGLISKLEGLVGERQIGSTAVLIQDEAVQGFEWAARLRAGWKGLRLGPFIASGEQSKSMACATELVSELAEIRVPRTGIVIALGGGVVGDLAGFVAATYLRGISFVQVPTTLLAMVDSSVGGKTGVNLPQGKNLVGAFHQPKLVVADLDTLGTLPAREFSSGMAEVIKYGAIKDRALFERVACGVKAGDGDLDAIVETCVAIKARIVERDEFETKGERALLNFGHTIGHAIERATGYKTYLHGEAISLGMRAAAWLSHWECGLPLAEVQALEQALMANGLPVHLDEPDDSNALLLTNSIMEALGNDKKVASDGKNRWVLLKCLGEAATGFKMDTKAVEAALNILLAPVTPRDVV